MIAAPFTPLELNRLLGRSAHDVLSPAQRAAFAGRRVLITGAGGTIGSELAREIASCGPAALGLLDHSELGLFAIERDVTTRWPAVPVTAALADVTRRAAIVRAIRDVRPDVVYHAAAYKHVTMTERAPAVAAHVNVIGTAEVADAAAASGARFVLISSDKAADPKSVMGATKRLAELATLSMASAAFRPVVVRFGNVLGSSGSVLQIMRDCARAGRPIPLTDPEATRYFMTATEAVGLVLRADLLGRGAEIVWLDMGRPVRLGDLVERLLDVEAERGYARVAIDVIGLRPGEKRTETLADPRLVFERTIDQRVRVARDRRPRAADMTRSLNRLRRAALEGDDAAALAELVAAVPGFTPSAHAQAVAARVIGTTAEAARPARRRRRAA